MRRRWFFLGGVLLFFMGLWVLEARPGELVPNEGGRTVAGDFFKAAIQPAVNFEDPEMQSGKVSFFEKLGKALWLTVRYALVAMSLALVIGIVGGVLGSRAWWSRPNLFLQVLRIGVRLLATAVRSVHELMWALLFLSAIGTSPLAAVFAMALPYGGTLAKVFSELLDEGENSAAEVIRVSGGGGFTAFFAGVVTNALPDLATYALYRLECAIRSSAVLGFVGIPTLGYEIKTAYEDGHYREIWTYLYALLVLVVLFEWWGVKVRSLLMNGVAARRLMEGDCSLARLWKARGRSWFLRASVVLLLFGVTAGWLVEDKWGAGVSWEQRMRNLDRFTDEIVPFPVREADGDWGEFGPWFEEKMSDGGTKAVWRTFHLGTAAILLAGIVALIGVRFAARTLVSSSPRGVREGNSRHRELLAMLLRGGSMLARAMPEYILAFLLLRVFGPTVWALIFALAIHNAGILLRLGAEVIDNTSSQASSVILAQGGSRSSAFVGALLPVGFNRLVLFLFYRWESCIREATVLGMLGVSSLGFLISDAKVSFFYDEMLLWVGLGAGLVFLGDLTSDLVRHKLRGKTI
jgi:phosphonate transport system permease protein|tara:strand:+ start:491 stop:2221 length:1731 start_codon:yes stop_codon:yes gene_type:complete